ncbi:PGPGW domain-containing protein [Dietzia cinnamea]|uniref:PGPGW domain-containing protein n=1 Tax=Dietzia cinnamea TaxID=321318 RepID=UPI0021A6EC2C|nr:PGPGW domain-containing protein [Dietzia cinnamea]MCT1885579.1 PGPGW domain-containing protein [Dietzia cinnamea]
MRRLGYVAARRLALETLGWTLVVLGVAALFLPGPGLLMLFAGTVVLSRQYEWFDRRLLTVKRFAMEGASRGVQSWPRIAGSALGVAWLIGLGLFWGIGSAVPGWWPLSPDLWLVGGWGTGGTLIFSGLVALALLVYAFRRFRGSPYDHEVEVVHDRQRREERRRARAARRHARAEVTPG